MKRSFSRALHTLVIASVAVASAPAFADPKTVCTITINSADEREVLRRRLPDSDYRVVELVKPGKDDWLASACRARVRCDVVVISGHFDGGTEFYSDRVDARESLGVDEIERAVCSDGCRDLFAQVQEVYLFGCNTLNADPQLSASPEIERSLVRSGLPADMAARATRELLERHAPSNRDQMRQLFASAPVIYGFSSKAPLGRYAGPLLDRHFRQIGVGEFARGRPSESLQRLFAPSSMTVARGTEVGEPQALHHADVCRFMTDDATLANKLAFAHELLRLDLGTARLFLDRIERLVPALDDPARTRPDLVAALAGLRDDAPARDGFLAFARDADEASVAARMFALATRLEWLTPAAESDELAALLGRRMASRTLNESDIALACIAKADGRLAALAAEGAAPVSVPVAAIRACLGDAAARTRVLQAVAGGDPALPAALAYLHQRPLRTAEEARLILDGVAAIRDADGQARVLEAIAVGPLPDPVALARLVDSFPEARSLRLQRAIAAVALRSDYGALASPARTRALRTGRIRSPDGPDIIDVLVRLLESRVRATS